MTIGVIYNFPIWVGAVFMVTVLLAAIEIGYRIGLRRPEAFPDADSGGGRLVLTSLSALLGLILAFTYAAGVSRNESRKQAVIAEGNAIGTAYLRAGLVDDPGGTALKHALRDYARTRTHRQHVLFTGEDLQHMVQASARVLARLWPISEQIVRQGPGGPIEASLVTAVNEVIDMHTTRVAVAFDKLPPAVLSMLILVSAISVAVGGFNAGVSGRIGRWRMSAFALVLTTIMTIIVDFDRPTDGFIRISQASLIGVIAGMEADLSQ